MNLLQFRFGRKHYSYFMSDNGQTNDFENAYNCEMRGFKGSEYEEDTVFLSCSNLKINYQSKLILVSLPHTLILCPLFWNYVTSICQKLPFMVEFNSLIEQSSKFLKSRIIVTDTSVFQTYKVEK